MLIVPMTTEYAADIATWRYEPPYERYSLTGSDPAFFADPANGYVALVDDGARLLGYRSFGNDGQVPGFDYDETALDTGGGLRPTLTGQGLGRQAIATGLAYGQERFAPQHFASPSLRSTSAPNGSSPHLDSPMSLGSMPPQTVTRSMSSPATPTRADRLSSRLQHGHTARLRLSSSAIRPYATPGGQQKAGTSGNGRNRRHRKPCRSKPLPTIGESLL